MSFQAYVDTIEDRTGLTPRELIAIVHDKGLDDPQAKAAGVVAWLKADYGLGQGHAMSPWHVIKNGPGITAKHVGTTGTHRDESDTLWSDGKATKPTARRRTAHPGLPDPSHRTPRTGRRAPGTGRRTPGAGHPQRPHLRAGRSTY